VGELLLDLAGADLAAVIVTAIDRDGTLTGPDLDGLRQVLHATELPVIASGGVASVADLKALAALEVPVRPLPRHGGASSRRLHGVISGRALVDGRMTVEEGVEACAPSG
jgi:phosphoribosylformimino-5-aminoimidazole carboxamide ribonucleotide (ProFAR) isomerase